VAVLAVGLAACGSNTSSTGSNSSAASYARTQPGSPAPHGQAGSISGHIGYPSEFLPAQAIYAISTDESQFYRVESVVGQQHYKMLGVPAGDYFVLAVARAPVRAGSNAPQQATRFGAAYTKMVLCGLSVECTDHALVPVHVKAGTETASIDPADWYAPANEFPVIPGGGLPVLTLAVAPPTFATSQDAAVDLAQDKTGGRYVKQAQDCPVNTACIWLASGFSGQNAAYFTGSAGSNADIQSCAFYVVGSNSAGWRSFDVHCRIDPDAFPARGSAGHVRPGMGETGCVNVRAAPAKTAKVLACLADGTQVRIDDGPTFVAPTSGDLSSLDLWWHISGQGWMVHQYLRNG
jgi:hypothetical protein